MTSKQRSKRGAHSPRALTMWAEHLEMLTRSILAQAERARRGSGHKVIKGAAIESIVRRTLREYLPAHFCVGTGQIATPPDRLSRQMDVLIYDHWVFPHLAVNEDGSVVIPAEAIYGAIETKSIWKAAEVSENMASFGAAMRKRLPFFTGHAGFYAALVVDKVPERPPAAFGRAFDGPVCVCSLSAGRGWIRRVSQREFASVDAAGLALLLDFVLECCLNVGDLDVGKLDNVRDALLPYFGWSPTPKSDGESWDMRLGPEPGE